LLTRKTSYGIRALVRLARAPRSVSVAELATREGIPEHFLSVILSDLRQRGLVRGRRGPDGGYQLNVDPSLLNLADVVESLGGPLFSFTCLQRGGAAGQCSECPGAERCPAMRALGRASAAAYAVLESITVADLAPAEPLPVALPEKRDGARAPSQQKLTQPARRAAGKAVKT
jgi:Rrf2 family protein